MTETVPEQLRNGTLAEAVIPDGEAETLRRAGRKWAATRQIVADELPGIDPDLEKVETRGSQRDR